MIEASMIWEYRPPRKVRLPGLGGASLTLTPTVSPEAMRDGLGVFGVDIQLLTPTYRAVHGRRPVESGFTSRLSRFLWNVASEFHPEISSETFSDDQARLTVEVLDSTEFTVTLRVEVVADDTNGMDDIDGVAFETTRAALITAAEEAEALGQESPPEYGMSIAEPALPLDLFYFPEERRLTGIYRPGKGIAGTDDLIAVFHYLSLDEVSHAEVETSFLAAHLPFCSVIAQGVDARRWPWVIVAQILPVEAHVNLAAPWQAVQVARQELHHAIHRMGGASIHGESAVTQADLVDLIHGRGVDRDLINDWTVEDLVLAGIGELTNAPIKQIAIGRLTGCAFPDLPHDCPGDVFACAFSRWQELLFNEGDG